MKRQNNRIIPSLFFWAPWSIYLLVENSHILMSGILIGFWSVTSGHCLISHSFSPFILVGIAVFCSRKESLAGLSTNSHS